MIHVVYKANNICLVFNILLYNVYMKLAFTKSLSKYKINICYNYSCIRFFSNSFGFWIPNSVG